ncbi:TPA: DUF7424 family protein [Enterobacter hormaechei]|uniref:DUF7424 family protein n=1 Tax=Atlantibacter sp. TaxID=1903473 RepID=UPI0028A76781|nr:hypothetical protein [Atlantibacter sp.]
MNGLTKTLVLFVATLILSGCKLEWTSDILFSKLFDKSITLIDSTLLAEVAACNSYEDSRKPSDSLLRVQGAVNDIFPEAKFNECYTQQFNSYAKFTLPIAYGAADMLKPEHPKLRVLSFSDKTVFVNIAPSLEDKLQAYQNNKLSVTDFKPSNVSIVINLKNDTGVNQKVNIFGAYLNNFPLIHQVEMDFKKDETFNIRLSNVTTEAMFLPAKFNQPAIFMRIWEK